MTDYRIPVLDTFGFQQPILDKDLDTPPVSPSKGDRYIVGAGGYTWLGVDSSDLNSYCGQDDATNSVSNALDGSQCWFHTVEETHYFILDLGSSKDIVAVRGRSNEARDPITVDVYISDSLVSWGSAVYSGSPAWNDNTDWVETDVTDKSGRYVKVEISVTEHGSGGYIKFGYTGTPFAIFDVAEAIDMGDWEGHSGEITYYDGAAWQFITPKEGWLVYVSDENKYYMFNGSAWIITSII